MRNKSMGSEKGKTKWVRMGAREVPAPTPADMARLRALPDGVPDDDTPGLWAEDFVRIGRERRKRLGAMGLEKKCRVTLYLDPSVVAAFKSQGPGYQTRINQELCRIVWRRMKDQGPESLIAEARHSLELAEAKLKAVPRPRGKA